MILITIICSILGPSQRKVACDQPVKYCMCRNRVSARSSSNSKSLWEPSFHAYDAEVYPDRYWTKGSGVRRRNIFVGPRAFDRSAPGARGTSSSFARRCCRFGAENNRTPAPYPGLRTWSLGSRDLSRRCTGRPCNAASRTQTGCGPGGRTFDERFARENIQPTPQHLGCRDMRCPGPCQTPRQAFSALLGWRARNSQSARRRYVVSSSTGSNRTVFDLGLSLRLKTALLIDLGAQGLGFIPVYSAVLDEIERSSRLRRSESPLV